VALSATEYSLAFSVQLHEGTCCVTVCNAAVNFNLCSLAFRVHLHETTCCVTV